MNTRAEKFKGREPRLLWVGLGLSALICSLSACYVSAGGPVHDVDGVEVDTELYYAEPPPPARPEVVVGVAPTPSHLWVGGYWTRHRDGWFWVRGRWAARPHANSVWVDGRWDHHPRGYVWVRGHWR